MWKKTQILIPSPLPIFFSKVNKTYWLEMFVALTSRDNGERNMTLGRICSMNLLQPSVLVLLRSLVSAQKPEMPALSEINFDFHSRAPDIRAECFQVLCSSAGPYHPTPLHLEKCSHPTVGDRFKRQGTSSWVAAE